MIPGFGWDMILPDVLIIIKTGICSGTEFRIHCLHAFSFVSAFCFQKSSFISDFSVCMF